MESYGAEVVYAVDSAGALVPGGARDRVAALREALACEVGFHAHNNLGCAVGNSLAAAEAGRDLARRQPARARRRRRQRGDRGAGGGARQIRVRDRGRRSSP